MSYFVYIEGELPADNEGCFVTYWFSGDVLSEAILISLKQVEIDFEISSQRVESVRHDGEDEPPEETNPTDNPRLWCFEEIQTWELSPGERSFVFPKGIVPANDKGPFEVEEIKEGFCEERDEGLSTITLVVDGRHFHEKIKTIFDFLPSRDGLEIDIKNHWTDKDRTEIWLAPPEFRDQKIIDYLFENRDDLIDNGGIEIAIYCRKEKATLRITDHKLVKFYAKDLKLIELFKQKIQRIGFLAMENRRFISEKYYHYHYSPVDSLSPDEMRTRLSADAFKQVDEREEK